MRTSKVLVSVVFLIVLVSLVVAFNDNYDNSLSLSSSLSVKANVIECWQFSTQSQCTTSGNGTCIWENDSWGSWCERPTCFNADFTNASYCQVTLREQYNLSCGWQIYGVNLCDPNGTSVGFWGDGCNDFDGNETGCYGTFWCGWNATNSSCSDPSNFGNDFAPVMNPSCGVIISQQTCQNITGCTWASATSTCSGNAGGIACSQLNKTICSDFTMLSTCCNWNGTDCKSTFEMGCYDAVSDMSAGKMFCEDYLVYNNQTACEEIAGTPWYMPCKWDNSSQECHFNSAAFGGTSSFDEIGTKKGCEAQGGVWETGQYNDGGVTKTDSWCEFKFGAEFQGSGNCDTACWACEFDSNVTSAATAETTCENSALDYCEFTADTFASNNYGWCKPKKAFVEGGAKSCKDECGACEFLATPQASCEGSPKECVWTVDTNAQNGAGYCYGKNEKRCANDCFSCYVQSDCTTNGKGGNGSCSWDASNNYCKPVGYNDEVCFDGKDNDNDAKVDCTDSGCATDKFCGGADLSVSFGADCPSFNSNSSCTTAGCVWIIDDFDSNFGNATDGFCDFPGAQCWQHDDNATVCNATTGCGYITQAGGICEVNLTLDESCFSQRNQTACNGVSGCGWNTGFGFGGGFGGGGWCEPLIFSQCFGNQTRQQSQNLCESNVTVGGTSMKICTWGVDTFTGQTGCNPTCFTQTNANCGSGVVGLCEVVTGLCEPSSFGGKCFEADGNETYCKGSLNGTCSWFADAFVNNNVSNHTTSSGNSSGWCNSKGAGTFVQFMGDVEPEIIGIDVNESGVDDRYDIEGVGLRDTFEKLIFGTRLYGKFVNSAICNGVPVYTNKAVTGSGTNNYTFFWYLDSDGNRTNNCVSRDNASQTGFEFSFKYGAGWIGAVDPSYSLIETKVSYQCVNGSWGPVPIPLTSAKQKACALVGGGMAGIDKKEMYKFKSYFNKSADLRLYATVGNTTTNDSLVNDSIGPLFYTQGAIDFHFEDCSDSGADLDNDGLSSTNDPDCFNFMKFGYVPNEVGFQCSDDSDNDGDGLKNCDDPGCKYSMECGGTGVPVQDANDKTAPKIIWQKCDTFPDSAFCMYDTDEPSNGTLSYYNDSACKTLNKTIRDIGMLDSFVSDYKVWHDGPIDSFASNVEKISYSLANATTYFYKTKVCDVSGNCAVSACLNFTTKSTFNDCKGCKSTISFPFTPPSGVAVSNPLGNISFNFEFFDGTKSNLTANSAVGLQLNYTQTKNFNLILENPNAANNSKWKIKLINASLSGKVAASVQNFSGGSDVQFNTTTNGTFVGLGGSKCQELVNIFRPKRLEIGMPGNDTDELWQCDAGLQNCTEKSSNATLIGYNVSLNLTIWQIPADWGC